MKCLLGVAGSLFVGTVFSPWLNIKNSHASVVDTTYKLVFADNFNFLDTRKWNSNWFGCTNCVTPPLQPAHELAAYDPAQVSVSGGTLNLRLRSNPTTLNGIYYPYRSGMVNSYGKATFTYGYFEARIYLTSNYLNSTVANWPGFIINGVTWPSDGENDVMEGLVTTKGSAKGYACYHYHSAEAPFDAPGACSRTNFSGWHTYGSLWKPGEVSYYYDGVKVGTIRLGVQSKPMYLILHYAVSSKDWWGGPTRVPAIMRIDYIRVWQKK
jgi:beta-glucanase (GH16 family)